MNQCSQPSWSKLNTAAMLHDVFSVTKTHYVRHISKLKMSPKTINMARVSSTLPSTSRKVRYSVILDQTERVKLQRFVTFLVLSNQMKDTSISTAKTPG